MGIVVTFYSYKGGTGRTMALANLAYLLARERKGARVLMVDWDLEAPGLHRYFHNLVRESFSGDEAGFDAYPGLIDLFHDVAQKIEGAPDAGSEQFARTLLESVSISKFIIETDVPGLCLLKAGAFDESYPDRVCKFAWEQLHNRSPWIFRSFAQYISGQFDYVLIDSRTGLTDTGGICTSILPEKLVVVFTPNRQSLLGALGVVREATRYRKESDDLRPLTVFPLVSRVEANEPQLRTVWRFGDAEARIPGYQPLFEDVFRAIYDLPECNLEAYFNEAQIQHVPWFAYGEEIAARVEAADRLSLTRSFEHVAKYLTKASVPWHVPEDELAASESGAAPPRIDEAWITSKRSYAEKRLNDLREPGLMEASFFLACPPDPMSHKRLFDAAKASQVPGTGWPIGAVVTVSEPSRPQSTEEGLIAEITDHQTLSYDYWVLRADGSFYFLRNLEEDSDCLLVDDRVERVTELLVYCRRLYSLLGVEMKERVRISLRHSGLRGRFLAKRVPDRPEAVEKITRSSSADDVQSEVIVALESLANDTLKLVQQLTRPLFWLFDFHEVRESEYDKLVNYRLQEWGVKRPNPPKSSLA